MFVVAVLFKVFVLVIFMPFLLGNSTVLLFGMVVWFTGMIVLTAAHCICDTPLH